MVAPPEMPPGWPNLPIEPEVIRVLRPADGSLVGELAVTPSQDVSRRVARGRSVQTGWASLTPRDRARRLSALLTVMEVHAKEVEDTIVAETGKPRLEAVAEFTATVDLVRYYLKTAAAFLKPKRVGTGWMVWKKGRILREPWGVVGIIAPWNFPFLLSMNPTATALFGGNAVVLKPSEFSPYSGLLVEDLARDAGLPEDLVQVVIGTGTTGEALVRSGVDKVFFTGGSETGKKVMAAASDTLTPVALELGGKDAAIVLEDADLDRTVPGVVWGAFQNAGQACLSIERVFVEESIYDSFLRGVLAEVRRVRAGSNGGVDVGPLTTDQQLKKVEKVLAEATKRGAAVLVGGTRTDPASNVLQPTVITDLPSGTALLNEETFGPVIPIVPVKDAEEAVKRTNEVPYGLGASVWTGDKKRGEALAARLQAGGVCVNDVISIYGVPSLPFGGVARSGFGRSKGEEGLAEMTRSRSVLVDRFGLKREPWWFPYSKESERLTRAGMVFRLKGGLKGLLAAAWFLLRGGRR